MSFHFRKLYADIVTDDGTVCVVYLAWFECLGLRRAYGAVELYWPDGRSEVLHACRPPSAPDFEEPLRSLEIGLDLPDGRFLLTYRVRVGGWEPAEPAPHPDLRWGVNVCRAEACGRWLGNARRPELRGSGYVDWVELHRATRTLGLRSLEWGRVHLPESSLVFSRIRFESGRTWQRAACWHADDRLVETRDFRLVRRDGGVRFEGPSQAVLLPGRTLHRGPAIDRRRFPGALERWACRALTGPASATRWVSRAGPSPRIKGGSGWAVHEHLRFGGHPLDPA